MNLGHCVGQGLQGEFNMKRTIVAFAGLLAFVSPSFAVTNT